MNFKKSFYETPDCEIELFDAEDIMSISDDDNDVSDPFDGE